MEFEYNKDITSLTTFGIPVKTAVFAEYTSERELLKISRSPEWLDNDVLHIGGGSNLLFVNDFKGLVLHSGIKGIVRYDKDPDTVYVIAGAAENWARFVDWCVAEGLAGLENLADIPGEVGAAPVQNVGAYGVEAGDLIHSVECFDTFARKTVTLRHDECRFAYRDSMFKHEGKDRYYVLRVSFKLRPSLEARNISYGPLRRLTEQLGRNPSISEVLAEVKKIRGAKLPDPAVIGSAGSFFKNPVIGEFHFRELDNLLRAEGLEIPHYPQPDGSIKLAAGWMIEKAGLKGYCIGGAQVYPDQCLVLVNKGGASTADVVALSRYVCDRVQARFGIRLEKEVNFIDSSFTFRMLGSGTSKGVPEVGCMCPVCTSSDIHDKRRRCSALLHVKGMNILIDPSPDFRQQALDAGIRSLDAVLITHSHFDHIGGLEDLRPIIGEHQVPIYVREDVAEDLRRRLYYLFREDAPLYPGAAPLDLHVIDDTPFSINGLTVEPINVLHGKKPIFGYRIGDFAYITDAKKIEEEERDKLRDLKLLIVNALRLTDHFAHFTLDEALELIRDVKPERAVLTHFNHEIGLHSEIPNLLPPNVIPGYDGLEITL